MILPLLTLLLTATPEDAATAASLAARSRQELKAGETTAALADIHKAYDLDPEPELLVPVADCEEAAGHNANAHSALRRYLAEVPDASNRPAIEDRIAKLASAPPDTSAPVETARPGVPPEAAPTGAASAATQAAPGTVAPPLAETEQKLRILPWILGAVGVAGLVVAAVGAGEISSYNSNVSVVNESAAGTDNASTLTPQYRSAKTWQPIAIVSVAVGAAAIGGAILTW